MDYKHLSELLSKVKKKEDFLKIILDIVNLDKEIEKWFCDYCAQKKGLMDQNKLEDDVKSYITDYKDAISQVFKKSYISSKDNTKIESTLLKLKEIFSNNKFSESFKKNVILKMIDNRLFNIKEYNKLISEIWDILFKTDSEKIFIFEKFATCTDPYTLQYASEYSLKYNLYEQYELIMKSLILNHRNYWNYIDYYEFLKSRGREDEAIMILRDGAINSKFPDKLIYLFFNELAKKHDENALYDLVRLSEKRIHISNEAYMLMYYYIKENDFDYEKCKEYLFKWMDNVSLRNIDKWYDECKATLTQDDFSKNKKIFIEKYKQTNNENYYNFLVRIGEYEEVVAYILRNSNSKSAATKEKCRGLLFNIFKRNYTDSMSIFCKLLLSFSRKHDSSLFYSEYAWYSQLFHDIDKDELWNDRVNQLALENDSVDTLLKNK